MLLTKVENIGYIVRVYESHIMFIILCLKQTLFKQIYIIVIFGICGMLRFDQYQPIHGQSGERWATGLAINCLLVGQHVSNGANSSFWQLPTQKVKTW